MITLTVLYSPCYQSIIELITITPSIISDQSYELSVQQVTILPFFAVSAIACFPSDIVYSVTTVPDSSFITVSGNNI